MRDPYAGTYRPRPPQSQSVDARQVTHAAAQGEGIGPHLWLHEDMVNALCGGQVKAGWSGGLDERGRRYVTLTTIGVRHTWILTEQRSECPQIPGTWLYEAVWPD